MRANLILFALLGALLYLVLSWTFDSIQKEARASNTRSEERISSVWSE